MLMSTYPHFCIQDPDPAPWLEVTPEMKVNNQKKPYGKSTTIEFTVVRSNESYLQMARRAAGFPTRPLEVTSRVSARTT